MLYDAYEVQRSLLAGASRLAGLGAGWLNNPSNPWGYSSMGPLVAASLEVFAHADVESQVTPCTEFVLGVKAVIGNRQRKNWVTHTLKVERIGASGEIGEAEESVQTLRKPRRKIGSVRAVYIES